VRVCEDKRASFICFLDIGFLRCQPSCVGDSPGVPLNKWGNPT
jgi:hypothetical protein